MNKTPQGLKVRIPATSSRGSGAMSPFHAVEICGGPLACAMAKGCAGHRYLSRESPPVLPLSQCDRPGQCSCRYRHHDDRRAGPRRANENGRPPMAWLKGERRERRGRRWDD